VRIFNTLEKWHNQASDTDFVWFPFLWLKLSPREKLNFGHTLKMTFLFGPYLALYNFLRLYLLGRHPDWLSLSASILKCTLFFFVWFNLVTKFFWNRRYRRLEGDS
jgi:hypothetical protein